MFEAKKLRREYNMMLRKGRNVMRGSRGVILAAAAMMAVLLIGVVLAASGTKTSTRPSSVPSPSSENPNHLTVVPIAASHALQGAQAGGAPPPEYKGQMVE